MRTGPNKGDLTWVPLQHHRVLQVLHNPRYAGAFSFGRRKERRLPTGRPARELLPRDRWIALIPDAHPGYITWDRVRDQPGPAGRAGAVAWSDRAGQPAARGSGPVAGDGGCGRCGNRMTVRYRSRAASLFLLYVCQRSGIEDAEAICQLDHRRRRRPGGRRAAGRDGDPLALEVALAVQDELEARAGEADQLRRPTSSGPATPPSSPGGATCPSTPTTVSSPPPSRPTGTRPCASCPGATEDYERRRQGAMSLDDSQRARIARSATDFPALWSDPRTPQRERKRMVRLLLADVTLVRDGGIAAHVRFKGGQTTSLRAAPSRCRRPTSGAPRPQ